MGLAAAIKAFEEKALLRMNKAGSDALEILGNASVVETQDLNLGRYGNGDIANNWHISVGAVNMVVPNGPDRNGTASLSRIKAAASAKLFYGKDNVVFLTNVMNYSYRANYLGWPMGEGTNGWVWTGKVPAYGFVGKAINTLKGRYM